MALTSKLTKTLDVPHEAGTTITIRKMSHYMLMMAADAKVEDAAKKMRLFDGVTLPEPSDEQRAQQADDPTARYDRLVVLQHGITAWSYDPPFTPDGATDLDEDTAEWAFKEIIAFSVRSADEGKASAGASPLPTDQGADAGLVS